MDHSFADVRIARSSVVASLLGDATANSVPSVPGIEQVMRGGDAVALWCWAIRCALAERVDPDQRLQARLVLTTVLAGLESTKLARQRIENGGSRDKLVARLRVELGGAPTDETLGVRETAMA